MQEGRMSLSHLVERLVDVLSAYLTDLELNCVPVFWNHLQELHAVYGAFWRCSRVRLYLRRKWSDLDKNWALLSILLIAAGPGKGHISVTCRITLNYLSTAAMRLMSNYFHHLSLDAHLDSRTDSQARRAEYCIVGIPHNTAIWFTLDKSCTWASATVWASATDNLKWVKWPFVKLVVRLLRRFTNLLWTDLAHRWSETVKRMNPHSTGGAKLSIWSFFYV